MTMIEQIARASHEFFRPIYNLPPFEELPDDAKSVMFQHAAAILISMEEPTVEMVSAAEIHTMQTESDIDDFRYGWRAAIQVAISEKPA